MPRSRRPLGLYLILVLFAASVVLAARIADPGPRVGSRARLIDLIEREDEVARGLRDQLARLQRELDALEARAGVRAGAVAALQRRIAGLGARAGLAAVRGPGLRVELRDSTLRTSPSGDLNDLVIHEQDLQAVVNGLWAAGAEAIAINGERLTSNSAVRCVGNTLLLHGSLYAPPYRVEAIGEPVTMRKRFDDDGLVERLHILAETYGLGFDVDVVDDLSLQAFRGVVALATARVS